MAIGAAPIRTSQWTGNAFQSTGRACLCFMELSMEIAFWTAKALARPLHALQRWWKNPTRTYAATSHHPAGGSQPALAITRYATRDGASASPAKEDHSIYHGNKALPCCAPSTLVIPTRLRLPCSVATHPAPVKNHRTSAWTASKNRDVLKPLRPMRCSASAQEAGHFFIAGRMADVCAELDRLAAHEAAH